MARRLNALNFVYTAVGVAVAAGIGVYVYRRIRNATIEGEGFGPEGQTQDNLMDLRRSTRKAGRAIKDTGTQIGKAVKRGASDVGESFQDATSSGKELLADTTGTNSSSSTGSTKSSRY